MSAPYPDDIWHKWEQSEGVPICIGTKWFPGTILETQQKQMEAGLEKCLEEIAHQLGIERRNIIEPIVMTRDDVYLRVHVHPAVAGTAATNVMKLARQHAKLLLA